MSNLGKGRGQEYCRQLPNLKIKTKRTSEWCPKAKYSVGGYQICELARCELSFHMNGQHYGCLIKEYQNWLRTRGWT